MGSAAEYLASTPDLIPAIAIDKQTNDKIQNYFTQLKVGLEQKTLQRIELIEKIVELELSEWNDIFLYVVNSLKDKAHEFKYPATRIQAHIKEIEYFLETVENNPAVLKKISQLPPVWVENILIVDDEPMIAELIKALLNRSGNIDLAHNGQDALDLIEKNYYKLIITDIDMPVMNGITLYQETIAKFPESINKFLFITGNLSPKRQTFFDNNRLKCLEKPMQIDVLREEAKKILLSQQHLQSMLNEN
jgi:CheY-like chemotaxis protein